MLLKKMLAVITGFVLLTFSGCTGKINPEGMYVHYNGYQKYYILTINKKDKNEFSIRFEGVPLELLKQIPWAYEFNGSIKNTHIINENVTLAFSSDNHKVTAIYRSGEKQIFISDQKDVETKTIQYK